MRWRLFPNRALALAMVTAFSLPVQAEEALVFIVHPTTTTEKVAIHQLADLYLQKTESLPGLDHALPLAMASGTPESAQFLQKVLDMTERDYKRYWAKEVFSGRRTPPREFKSAQEIIDEVASNPKAVGCIPGPVADTRVKVISLVP